MSVNKNHASKNNGPRVIREGSHEVQPTRIPRPAPPPKQPAKQK